MYFTQESASKAEEEGGVWTQGWYGVVLRRAFMEELLRAVRWAFEDPSRAMEVGNTQAWTFNAKHHGTEARPVFSH